MEKHRCKLCSRKFSNGRALGGHMRSHMMNLPLPPKHRFEPESSSDSQQHDQEEPTGSSSLIDRESETESFKNKPTRKRRSCRIIRNPSFSVSSDYDLQQQQHCSSSISEVTSDEDLALCLMMMSRDKWDDDYNINNNINTYTSSKKKYKCDTCYKSFKSYQALGGHRASHKKTRVVFDEFRRNCEIDNEDIKEEEDEVVKMKVHECPVCFRVFASGQALGGHKRSHVLAANGGSIGISHNKINDSLIDLNLPATAEDDDDSAVSHVHFL